MQKVVSGDIILHMLTKHGHILMYRWDKFTVLSEYNFHVTTISRNKLKLPWAFAFFNNSHTSTDLSSF